MSSIKEIERTDTQQMAVVKDRRRPGRLAHVSPELIPLLRGELPPLPDVTQVPEVTQFGEPDQLASVRGLPLAVGLSAALWACIAYAGRLILS